MSEYWKSTPKYWCKHCSTYVKDTPLEKKQHESTGKHQGNLKRFLRGIQNDHEKGEREKEKAKAEVERLNRVVGGQPSVGEPSTTKPSAIRRTAAGAPTAVDQKRQWAQLAEMGIQVPENFRAEMAMPGQWQSVPRQPDELSSAEESLNKGVRKRKVEGEEEEEHESDVIDRPRGWGTTTRRYPEQNDLDLDALLNSPVVKKESTLKTDSKPEPPETLDPKAEIEIHPSMTTMPKLSEPETNNEPEPRSTALAVDHANIKDENGGLDSQPILTNIAENSPVPVFKKRKFKTKAGQDND